jgi:hypothetical protein
LSELLQVVRWVSKVPSVRDGAPVNARRRSVEPGGSGECPEALGECPEAFVSVLETLGELPKRLGGGILARSGEPEFSKHSLQSGRAPGGSGVL